MRRRVFAFHTLDVFTDVPFSGNPVAVFADADGLDDGSMQRIARELNLSETVFVFPPRDPRSVRRLRIFTPRMELPFAGHPTVGTAILLVELGAIELVHGRASVVLEEGTGPVPVDVWREGPGIAARIAASRPHEYGPPALASADAARLVSLEQGDVLDDDWVPLNASAGVPYLLIPVRDTGALSRARLDLQAWQAELSRAWAPHVYVFVPPASDGVIRARMFAPAMGIVEDPATGAAALALAGVLADRDRTGAGRLQWTLEQGVEMGRPSRMHLDAERNETGFSLAVSGSAVIVARGEIVAG